MDKFGDNYADFHMWIEEADSKLNVLIVLKALKVAPKQ
jgi:hypothetical protein